MAYNEDSSASGHDEPWIQWFCGLKGHEMFCEVERSYIEDGFNLYGLRACVSNFSDCLDLILDRIGPDDSDDSHLTQSACTLYGLIHARYIITAHGLDAMYNKYAAKEFGTCPLIQCFGQPVLPVGLKDEMGNDTVKIFCPKCQCIYHPPPVRSRSSHHGPSNNAGSGAVDGAAFGTTFPHLFLMTFNNLVPDGLSPESAYVPRVFGFRVHQSARQRIGCGGPGSAAFYSSTVGNSRRGNGPIAAPSSSMAAGSGANGASERLSPNTADVDDADAAANDDTGSRAQDQGAEDDKTSATPAAETNQSSLPAQAASDELSNQKQTKNKGSGVSTKVGKKGLNDNETKHRTSGDGKKAKDPGEDSGSASKRKVKTSGGGKFGNGGEHENGSVGKSKRLKRQNNGVS